MAGTAKAALQNKANSQAVNDLAFTTLNKPISFSIFGAVSSKPILTLNKTRRLYAFRS